VRLRCGAGADGVRKCREDRMLRVGKVPAIVEAFEKAKKASSKAEIMKLTSF
jgi:hypothetical protein